MVQVDPIKPKLKSSGTKRLKMENDELLSSFAFKFNLGRFNKEMVAPGIMAVLAPGVVGRGLHSFPIQFNLSSSVHRITRLSS